MPKKAAWFVRLGPLEWPRYTYARPDGDSLQLLGSVRRGPQMGALAVTTEGRYVQVVGDFITPLNNGQITRAIAKASESERFSAPRAIARVTPVPVVIVKRRCVFVAA